MVDIDAAIGFVVARGDSVDRARLSWLRSGHAPAPEVLDKAELGQTAGGGWPAFWAGDVASIDATCFRLAELDALQRPAARRALAWLASRQRPDGTWEESQALADFAPPWAKPGDPEARLYLTVNTAFTLLIGGPAVPAPSAEANALAEVVARATQAFRATLRDNGTWPSFLVTGWLGAALLFHAGWYYEAAQIQVVLGDRVPEMSPADTAWMASSLRRVGMSADDWLMMAARKRLTETQRTDGGWPSDDGPTFDVHATLAAIRALR